MIKKKKNSSVLVTAAALLFLVAAPSYANPFVTTAATSGTTTGAEIEEEDNDFAQARRFTRSQLAQIQRDAATGNGENIQALANLLGEADTPAFSLWIQQNYQVLFFDLADADQLVDRIVHARELAS